MTEKSLDLSATIVECPDDPNCPGTTISVSKNNKKGSRIRLMLQVRDSGRGYSEEKINLKTAKEHLLQREKDLISNLQDVQEMIKILKIRS